MKIITQPCCSHFVRLRSVMDRKRLPGPSPRFDRLGMIVWVVPSRGCDHRVGVLQRERAISDIRFDLQFDRLISAARPIAGERKLNSFPATTLNR